MKLTARRDERDYEAWHLYLSQEHQRPGMPVTMTTHLFATVHEDWLRDVLSELPHASPNPSGDDASGVLCNLMSQGQEFELELTPSALERESWLEDLECRSAK